MPQNHLFSKHIGSVPKSVARTYDRLYAEYSIVIKKVIGRQAQSCHVDKFAGPTIVRWKLQIVMCPHSQDGEDKSDLLEVQFIPW